MSFFNSEYPLGLPKGSIRAIIILMIVGGCFRYFFQYNSFPADLTTLLGAAVGYYIGGRSKESDESVVTLKPPQNKE